MSELILEQLTAARTDANRAAWLLSVPPAQLIIDHLEIRAILASAGFADGLTALAAETAALWAVRDRHGYTPAHFIKSRDLARAVLAEENVDPASLDLEELMGQKLLQEAPEIERLAGAGNHGNRARWLLTASPAQIFVDHLEIRAILASAGFWEGLKAIDTEIAALCAVRDRHGYTPAGSIMARNLARTDLAVLAYGGKIAAEVPP